MLVKIYPFVSRPLLKEGFPTVSSTPVVSAPLIFEVGHPDILGIIKGTPRDASLTLMWPTILGIIKGTPRDASLTLLWPTMVSPSLTLFCINYFFP